MPCQNSLCLFCHEYLGCDVPRSARVATRVIVQPSASRLARRKHELKAQLYADSKKKEVLSSKGQEYV